jgi:hypothetical protein
MVSKLLDPSAGSVMDRFSIEDGDLLAYLAGEPVPHVEQALQESPELRQELEDLRRSTKLFSQLFHELERPDPQDLIDVITGQASDMQQLRVAAYTRRSAAGRAEYQVLEKEFRELTRPQSSRRQKAPKFLAQPLNVAGGLRSTAPDEALSRASSMEQSYVVQELQAQITLTMAHVGRDYWQLEGYVTRQQSPAPAVRVKLAAEQAHPRPRITNELGFFTFARLRSGTYQLEAQFETGSLLISDLVIGYAQSDA